MTDERKAEVNRRLAEYEGVELWDTHSTTRLGGEVVAQSGWGKYPDYTADLNALARLEAKLPHHWWTMEKGDYTGGFCMVEMKIVHATNPSFFGGGGDTEAEARAEAICQYLESIQVKDADHPQP